jgi:hypothetical protein
MKIRYDKPSIRISIIITDREHIYRWGRTHRSHERFSHRKWGPSRRYRRSVGCSTAGRWVASPLRTTGCLKSRSLPGCALPLLGSEISVRTVLTCTRVHRRISFARLRQGRDLLTLFASPRGMASEAGHTEFSGTIFGTDRNAIHSVGELRP